MVAVYFGSQNRMKNERDYIAMRTEQQKKEKEIEKAKQQKIDNRFQDLADKDRLHSVNVFLPSKLNI